ncbi:MAG: TcpE family conjugal transfer membrane protein [Egibacteraceae bacterium]
MLLPTFTSIWRIERRLYKVYDWVLPMPISIPQMAVFLVSLLLWALLLQALGVELHASTGWLYLVPPGFAAWVSERPLVEEKRPHELAAAQVRYLFEPRTLYRLAEHRQPERVHLSGTFWSPR